MPPRRRDCCGAISSNPLGAASGPNSNLTLISHSAHKISRAGFAQQFRDRSLGSALQSQRAQPQPRISAVRRISISRSAAKRGLRKARNLRSTAVCRENVQSCVVLECWQSQNRLTFCSHNLTREVHRGAMNSSAEAAEASGKRRFRCLKNLPFPNCNQAS